jgi:hypothetical protein
MPEMVSSLGGGTPGRGESLPVQELITRAQRLVDAPRPASGRSVAWQVEAMQVADLTVIAALALRSSGSD